VVEWAGLRTEWETLLDRRADWRKPLGFWTRVLDAWAGWRPGDFRPLDWTPAACRERWGRGVPLLLEADLPLPREAIEGMIGPLIEPLALCGPDEEQALRAFARQWDDGAAGPADLLPLLGKGGSLGLGPARGGRVPLAAFLAQAGLRPPLETYFSRVRILPAGLWTASVCPWCGGSPGFVEIVADGGRRVCCHLCGGGWAPMATRCPWCEEGDALVHLTGTAVEPGDIVEACRVCHGYVKGVDRRQRPTALSPLVEDWGSPHLDVLAMGSSYQRPTPSIAQLLVEA
jgi:hypothetical protein